MNFPGHTRASLPSPPVSCGFPLNCEAYPPAPFDFQLPVLPRSIGLLRVLLQDAIVDLNLASSVLALDPGLAYRVLQLANRNLPDDRDRIWQLPLAIVAAGRASFEELLDQPQISSVDCRWPAIRSQVEEAVLRACMAHSLAGELASCPPRKCFLSGLLFGLPALVALSSPPHLDSQAMLLSDMCHSLPVALVTAALAQASAEEEPTDPLVVIVLIAQELLRRGRLSDCGSSLEELAAHPLWGLWQGLPALQRRKMLQRCCELTRWTCRHWDHMQPWEFMARLESSKACD